MLENHQQVGVLLPASTVPPEGSLTEHAKTSQNGNKRQTDRDEGAVPGPDRLWTPARNVSCNHEPYCILPRLTVSVRQRRATLSWRSSFAVLSQSFRTFVCS